MADSRTHTKETVHRERMNGSFFGRRKTKSLRGQQADRLTHLLPQLRLELTQEPPKTIGDLFEAEAHQSILEIGFGAGEHLVQRATENPASGFIGVEPFINGMAMGLAAIEKAGIENVRLFDEDATQLFDWLPHNSLDIVYLLYPDPWPKRRHWKRRFINQKNLTGIANLLKPGGELRFASDFDHYVNWTLLHCADHPSFTWRAENSQDWLQPWDGWRSTRYEKKAIKEGRKSAYLTFVCS